MLAELDAIVELPLIVALPLAAAEPLADVRPAEAALPPEDPEAAFELGCIEPEDVCCALTATSTATHTARHHRPRCMVGKQHLHRSGRRPFSTPAMAREDWARPPRDSISTASSITLENVGLDDEDYGTERRDERDDIELDTLFEGPLPGLRRITPEDRTRRWIHHPQGLAILVSVVLSILVFILLLPWLAGADRAGETPDTSPARASSSVPPPLTVTVTTMLITTTTAPAS